MRAAKDFDLALDRAVRWLERRGRLGRWAAQCVIVAASALPNLAITASTVTVLAVLFHWSGFLATAAYLIGQVFSVQWSVTWARLTKANFRLGRWHYRFSKDKGEAGA